MKQNFYLYTNGEIKRHDNTIRFVSEFGDKRDLPIENIKDLYVMNDLTFNTSFINIAAKYGINIHYFNYYSYYTGSFYPKETLVSGKLLVSQVEHYLNEEKRLILARKFIEAAYQNIYRNLRYYNGRGKNLKEYMDEISEYKDKISSAKNVPELMGYEGNMRKIYYSSWNTIVDQKIDFEKRVKNPPDNMINTLISFVNTLIYTRCVSSLYHTQLNPTVSYLHEPGTRRFSLSLDLAEIFKPLIGDRLIFSLLNKNQISEKCFTKEIDYLHLTKDASRTISSELDERLKKTIFHKELKKNVSYEHLIKLECYKLIKHLLGEKEYDGFKIWW